MSYSVKLVIKPLVLLLLSSALFVTTVASAHHSVQGNFDSSQTIELEGEITKVAWRNPHIVLTMRATDGSDQEWQLETHSISIMRRLGVPEPFVAVGDHIKAAGWPARRYKGIFVNNMLLANGAEFVFKFEATPADLLWSDRMWGNNDQWFAESGDSSANDLGIFRVWSTSLAKGMGEAFIWLPEYPLTENAKARLAEFEPATDDPLLDCGLKGMPAILAAPYPVQFHDRGDEIHLQFEEYDSMRTIYMNPQTAAEPEPSLMGYSVGHWEDDTLVVKTTHVDWGHFDTRGIYLGDGVEFVERFTPVEDGGKLAYQLTVTDDYAFTEPVVLGKSWVWLPDVKIEPYECVSD